MEASRTARCRRAATSRASSPAAALNTPPGPLVPAATNPLVMWAYTDLSDKRWKFTKKYLMLKQDPENKEPQKIGHYNPDTWGAYLLGSELFLKRYRAEPGKPYTDFGCSFEIFSRNDLLELETLGPLQKVEPGASVEHVEAWSLHRGVEITDFTESELDRVFLPLLTLPTQSKLH